MKKNKPLSEPGYAFRKATPNAAAHGVLRTNQTLKEMIEAGQRFGPYELDLMIIRSVRALKRARR